MLTKLRPVLTKLKVLLVRILRISFYSRVRTRERERESGTCLAGLGNFYGPPKLFRSKIYLTGMHKIRALDSRAVSAYYRFCC